MSSYEWNTLSETIRFLFIHFRRAIKFIIIIILHFAFCMNYYVIFCFFSSALKFWFILFWIHLFHWYDKTHTHKHILNTHAQSAVYWWIRKEQFSTEINNWNQNYALFQKCDEIHVYNVFMFPLMALECAMFTLRMSSRKIETNFWFLYELIIHFPHLIDIYR